jgi:hypothetical protein
MSPRLVLVLAEICEARGISATELHHMLVRDGYNGHSSTIYKWLHGESEPHGEACARLTRVLGLTSHEELYRPVAEENDE